MTLQPPDGVSALIDQAWSAISRNHGDGFLESALPEVEVTGLGGRLRSRFAAENAAVACVATALRAAVVLQSLEKNVPPFVVVDRDQVSAAVSSERYFRVDGRPAPVGFAGLSKFWKTSDGWVRTHANFPWHKETLLRVLGTTDDSDRVAEAMSEMKSVEAEERIFSEGGICAAVRTMTEWRQHPQGLSLRNEPLVGREIVPGAQPKTRSNWEHPASGVRVLDMTRVIAGPVCTRFLGALGADVLRIDPPGLPDLIRGAPADTLAAKRSAIFDVGAPAGGAKLDELLASADVVVQGYRPGSLDRFGLAPAQLAERHPGLVIVCLDAWGHSGPWSDRRGFDSIVQAACGIAMGESGDGPTPGALPCQLLDHGTGYLAAAAVLEGLWQQAREGGTHVRRLSLARTADWLVSTFSPRAQLRPAASWDPSSFLVELPSGSVSVSLIGPPGRVGDHALSWPSPMTRYGEDVPDWSGTRRHFG